MENPFRYGIVVDEPYFIDREDEMEDISLWLKSNQSLVIYSPRRYGKSSLILKTLKNLNKEKYHTIYLDFFKIHSRSQFVELYYNEIFKKLPSWEKAFKKISGMVKGIRPSISLDSDGSPKIGIDYQESNSLIALQEVLDLPQKLAKDKPWIIVFDEFQEINKLNGDNFEKEMRSCLIHHDKVSYVFLGSQTHMLLNMFTHKNRAFYQFAKILELKKVPERYMHKYLADGLAKTGLNGNDALITSIIETANNIPHYVQYLASAVWERGMEINIMNENILEKAIDKIINNQRDFFMSLFDRLTSYQQKVLFAILKEPVSIFNQEYRNKFNLSAESSTQRAVKKLIELEILEKHQNYYHFPDPFFRKWLMKM